MMPELKELVARAIARDFGDDFDALPADKPAWVAERGKFGGRFRDVNAPKQCDYLDMAETAIATVDAYRAKEKRATCKHENRIGSGYAGSAGQGWFKWHCQACGASYDSTVGASSS